MNVFHWVLVGLAAAWVGCGDNKPKAPAPAGAGNPVTAPVDYLGALNKGKKAAETMVDVTVVTAAVKAFKDEEGRLPTDMAELMRHGFLRSIPAAPYGMKVVYNPANGEVAVVKDPAVKP